MKRDLSTNYSVYITQPFPLSFKLSMEILKLL